MTLHDFTIGGATRHNVVCTQKGASTPGKHLLIGAHYDSRMSDLSDPASPAPGSDDNGSGSAALLELARVLHAIDVPCSVRFVAFSGEEQGLIGSSAYAAAVRSQGLDLRLMINLDMIGHPDHPTQSTIIARVAEVLEGHVVAVVDWSEFRAERSVGQGCCGHDVPRGLRRGIVPRLCVT